MVIKKSTFAIDVKKFGVKTAQNARLLVRRIALDVFGRIVVKTPVGNLSLWKSGRAPPGYVGGRLRGNWQTSIGSPAPGDISRRQREEKGAVQAESELVALGWSGDGSIFLTNNLPYAEAIENGHSSQTPAGMVRVTLTEYPGIVERRARETRSK